jgi:hypothetical protein
MPGTQQDAMRCPEFEAMLAEALDGLLPEDQQLRFQEHRESCQFCGPMFTEAEVGRSLLRFLDEVAPPQGMVEQILAATSGSASGKAPARPSSTRWGWVNAWVGERGFAAAVWNSLAPLAQPRFAMSFAMVFFSLAMLLNVSGLRVSDFRASELRPATFVRAYEQTTGKLVRYYENIRIVYEIQSRVQELRESTVEAEPASPDNKVEPARPTGGLERGASPYTEDAWLQDLPLEPVPLKQKMMQEMMQETPVRARMQPASKPGMVRHTTSDFSTRSTL